MTIRAEVFLMSVIKYMRKAGSISQCENLGGGQKLANPI